MENRLARIIKPIDGKAVMLAVDHGYFLGPTEKLEDPRKTVEPLVKYCDSLMLTRGIQRSCASQAISFPTAVTASTGMPYSSASLTSLPRFTILLCSYFEPTNMDIASALALSRTASFTLVTISSCERSHLLYYYPLIHAKLLELDVLDLHKNVVCHV